MSDPPSDHNDYLAIHVLNEGETVSYRNLSRALKIHVNTSKRLLADFYQRQNKKQARSVHATYLLKGTGKSIASSQANGTQDEDTVMQSSPPFPSSAVQHNGNDEDSEPAEAVNTFRVTVVNEEELENVRSQFESLQSIHIYSLQPGSIPDMQVLTDCSRRVALVGATEDPLQAWKMYGTIQNDQVRRRTTRKPTPPVSAPVPAARADPKPAASATKAAPVTQEKPTSKGPAAVKRQESDDKSSRPVSRTSSTSGAKPPTVKRESSNIFKAFANTAAPKKAKTDAVKAKEDDMPALSDEEADGEEMDVDDTPKPILPGGKSKKDREADLRAMMDMEDEEMLDADMQVQRRSKATFADLEKNDTNTETRTDSRPRDKASEPSTQEADSEERNAEAETIAAETEPDANADEARMGKTSGGRRRGRRRVTKKRTIKDDEGYLVTKEETVWESFSEDEPVAAAVVGKTVAVAAMGKKSAAAGAGAGTGAKKGQGNIMSFFGKK